MSKNKEYKMCYGCNKNYAKQQKMDEPKSTVKPAVKQSINSGKPADRSVSTSKKELT